MLSVNAAISFELCELRFTHLLDAVIYEPIKIKSCKFQN
jgi:hypothetical protein